MTDQLVADPASGLFSEAMLLALLPSRVATARRTLRQLGLALLTVDDGPEPRDLAAIVRGAVRDSDMAARLEDGTVAVVLEFTPSEGCLIVVDRLRDRIREMTPDAVVHAGVACYPAHAISADELVQAAREAAVGSEAGEALVAPIPD